MEMYSLTYPMQLLKPIDIYYPGVLTRGQEKSHGYIIHY